MSKVNIQQQALQEQRTNTDERWPPPAEKCHRFGQAWRWCNATVEDRPDDDARGKPDLVVWDNQRATTQCNETKKAIYFVWITKRYRKTFKTNLRDIWKYQVQGWSSDSPRFCYWFQIFIFKVLPVIVWFLAILLCLEAPKVQLQTYLQVATSIPGMFC